MVLLHISIDGCVACTRVKNRPAPCHSGAGHSKSVLQVYISGCISAVIRTVVHCASRTGRVNRKLPNLRTTKTEGSLYMKWGPLPDFWGIYISCLGVSQLTVFVSTRARYTYIIPISRFLYASFNMFDQKTPDLHLVPFIELQLCFISLGTIERSEQSGTWPKNRRTDTLAYSWDP